MLGKIARIFYKRGSQPANNIPKNLWDIKVLNIKGEEEKLAKYQGKKAYLFVNVASNCGFTGSNYRQLQEIYDKYSEKGLEILGFPCNQFGDQEQACELDIANFVKGKFSVTFPMFSKIEVNGDSQHELYTYLKGNSELFDSETGQVKDIGWNFAKFLVDENGKVEHYFQPDQSPKTFASDIKQLLTH